MHHRVRSIFFWSRSFSLMFPFFRLDPETEQDGRAGEIESACFYGAKEARNVTRSACFGLSRFFISSVSLERTLHVFSISCNLYYSTV